MHAAGGDADSNPEQQVDSNPTWPTSHLVHWLKQFTGILEPFFTDGARFGARSGLLQGAAAVDAKPAKGGSRRGGLQDGSPRVLAHSAATSSTTHMDELRFAMMAARSAARAAGKVRNGIRGLGQTVVAAGPKGR
jgi:hypothetical protein